MLAKNLSITVGSAGFQCLQICLVDLLENDWFSGDKDKKHFVFNYDEVPQNVAIFMFLCARFFGA